MMKGTEDRPILPLSRLAILGLLAACASPDGSTPTGLPSPGPAGSRFTVTGVVYDSLASLVGSTRAATGVRVSVNGVVDITDMAGRFTVTEVLGGPDVPFELQGLEFELAEGTMSLDRDITVHLPLRRLAPLITGFFPAGDSTLLTVVDLQTRKAVERWQRTRATLANATTQWTQHGNEWAWHPVDSITWLVSMPNTVGAEEFRFDIHDATGAISHAVCRVGSGCDHLAPVEANPEE